MTPLSGFSDRSGTAIRRKQARAMIEARDIVTRTRRFAHMIVPSSVAADEAVFTAINAERETLALDPADSGLQLRIYQSLCDYLVGTDAGAAGADSGPAQPVIRKFRSLPIVNRLAFALMVIEEYPADSAARILRLPDTTLEEKILQSRRLLFEE